MLVVRSAGLLLLAACLPLAAAAERPTLKLQAKHAAEPSRTAPLRAEAANAPQPELKLDPKLATEPIPGSCTVSTSMVCYDYRNGRAVFKPARELMPDIAGLKRENLTLKRDKITFSYSF